MTLPGPGPQRVLRTYDDALALRALLRPGLRLAIVGAGWIGAELADGRRRGRAARSRYVEAGSPAPLAGALGAAARGRARRQPWYEQAGVELRTGHRGGSDGGRGGWRLGGGPELEAADEIVTAVGVRPAVSWLAGSGGGPGQRRVAVDTPGCARRCQASTRRGTARRSRRCGSASGYGSSTGRRRCTRRRSSRPTSLGGARGLRPGAVLLVRAVRPHGPVRRATTPPPTASSGAATRPPPPGRPAGCPGTRAG